MVYQKDYRIKLENEDSFCINIKDFLFEFIRKFPILIICAVVCALVLTGIGFIANRDSGNSSELSQGESEEVNRYKYLEEKYNELSNSIVRDIDENLTNYDTIQYQIKCEDETIVDDVMVALNNYIVNNGTASDIATRNNKWKYDDLKYLLTSKLAESANGSYSSVLKINVYGTDANMCQEIATEVDIQINELISTMKATMGNIECDIINKNSLVDVSTHISTMKANLSSQMNGISKEMNALQSQVNTANNNSVGSLLKQIVIGAIIGGVLGVVAIAMIYLLNGKIKYERELHERFGLRCFGQYDKKTKEGLKYILTRVENILGQNGENIVICSENKQESSELVESLAKRCKNVKFVAVEDVLSSDSAMAIITNKTKVILLEEGHSSKLKDVRNKLAVCGENEAEVLGYIMCC